MFRLSPSFSLALSIVFAIGLTALAVFNAHAGQKACGKASWYEFTTKTASGEQANPNKMTAAHRSLPFGTKVRVTNARNGRSVMVRINDRGPFIKNRIIDVTRAAADKLGFRRAGIARVCITIES